MNRNFLFLKIGIFFNSNSFSITQEIPFSKQYQLFRLLNKFVLLVYFLFAEILSKFLYHLFTIYYDCWKDKGKREWQLFIIYSMLNKF